MPGKLSLTSTTAATMLHLLIKSRNNLTRRGLSQKITLNRCRDTQVRILMPIKQKFITFHQELLMTETKITSIKQMMKMNILKNKP